MREIEADYVIVGAGSAGCVLANRLSEDACNQVVLLEAGGKDRSPWIHIPVGYFKTMGNPAVDWCYETQSDPGLNGRTLPWPRGKVLGGTSSINGLLYVRGQPADYERWQQLGNPGWGWKDVLPLFRKSEDQERGEDEYHGAGGPLAVSDMRLRRPICDAWVEAAVAAGYPANFDCNGRGQEGVGYYQLTSRNGRRCSSAQAFLKPARNRNNLRIITRALTRKVVIESGCAIGVIFRDGSGNDVFVKARREVVLSSGAIGSPQILMLSGIGDQSELKSHGVEVVSHLQGVGKNLQDHLQARLVFKCNEATLNDEVRSVLRRMRIGLRYLAFREGPMTMAASLAAGFLRTRDDLENPDIQFHIQPWSADSPSAGAHPFSAFTASVCQLRPESRGEIKLTSGQISSKPEIHPKYLSTDVDCQTIVAGIRVALKIAEHAPLSTKISDRLSPSPELETDDELLDWARSTATTIYHPTGTCKMGSGKDAVVDSRLRVHGITSLRVADCSIMPEIVSGNTNAPAIMIGEKASSMILEDAKFQKQIHSTSGELRATQTA